MQQARSYLKEFFVATPDPSPEITAQLDALNSRRLKLAVLKTTKLTDRSTSVSTAPVTNKSSPQSPEHSARRTARFADSLFIGHSHNRRKGVLQVRTDYSHVPNKVVSFRQKIQLHTADGERHRLKDAQQRLRNEMMMRNNHHLLRTMKRELKKKTEIEQVASQETKDFRKLYERLTSTDKQVRPETDQLKPQKREISRSMDKSDLLESSHAIKRAIEYDSKAWRQKRGLDTKSMPSLVTDFIKALYDVLDPYKIGEVSGQSLLKSLVALGLCEDPQVLKQVSS